MKPEHERVIEAMILSAEKESGAIPGAFTAMRAALRAAAERGYVLAKLPDPADVLTVVNEEEAYGFLACLDEIEIVELDDEDSN